MSEKWLREHEQNLEIQDWIRNHVNPDKRMISKCASICNIDLFADNGIALWLWSDRENHFCLGLYSSPFSEEELTSVGYVPAPIVNSMEFFDIESFKAQILFLVNL
jgi:uncharacterized protein YaeQ